jgi:hypothetical protein
LKKATRRIIETLITAIVLLLIGIFLITCVPSDKELVLDGLDSAHEKQKEKKNAGMED